MPEAILKFKLPEEREDFEKTVKAIKYYLIIWDTEQDLRDIVKYEDEEYSKEHIEGIEHAREILWENLEKHGIDIYSEE